MSLGREMTTSQQAWQPNLGERLPSMGQGARPTCTVVWPPGQVTGTGTGQAGHAVSCPPGVRGSVFSSCRASAAAACAGAAALAAVRCCLLLPLPLPAGPSGASGGGGGW